MSFLTQSASFANSSQLSSQARDLDTSTAQLEQALSKLDKKVFSKTQKKQLEELSSSTARSHLANHQTLQKTVLELFLSSDEKCVPAHVIISLERSQKTLQDAAKRIPHATKLISPQDSFVTDPCLLTASLSAKSLERTPSTFSWELHFSLLHDIYKKCDDEPTQHLLRFMMMNYLAKAAYFNFDSGTSLDSSIANTYQSSLQTGQMTMQGLYHRLNDEQIPKYLELPSLVGSGTMRSTSLFALDTIDIEQLYPIGFNLSQGLSNPDELVDTLVKQFESHQKTFPADCWDKPIVIDISEQLAKYMITQNDPTLMELYKKNLQLVKEAILKSVDQSIDKILHKFPEHKKSRCQILHYLLHNIAIVSRAQINPHLAVLSLCSDMFACKPGEDTFSQSILQKRNNHLSNKFRDWVNHTGISIGGVHFRQAMALNCKNPLNLQNYGSGHAVKYLATGPLGQIYYPHPKDVLNTNIFTSLKELGKQEPSSQQFFAKATTAMMEKLFSSISLDSWSLKQKDPIYLELTQTICFLLNQDLSAAYFYQSDFRKFSQAIDRVHSHLASLLAIYQPFDSEDFTKLYQDYIDTNIPFIFSPSIGIAKAAMNVFAGVNAALYTKSSSPVRVAMSHSYYEEPQLLGSTSLSLDAAFDDASIEKIDLYVAEFNHNIELDPTHTHYKKGPVIEDIRKIFQKKPKTDALTVAIDATIDFTQSEDVYRLLETFTKEILEGRLNIVIFRSGQKFDMLGLDNYFGSPFYIINNKDPKWDAFEKIKSDKAYQTDPLSLQFFTWLAHTDPSIVDSYKKHVFDNAKTILSQVPSSLLPDNGKEISVSTFNDDVKTPFIEILITGPNEYELRQLVQKRFMEIFTTHNKLVYVRGSFGFPHPNITWIEPKMRINPGIDSSDNPLYEEFFKELEVILEQQSEI